MVPPAFSMDRRKNRPCEQSRGKKQMPRHAVPHKAVTVSMVKRIGKILCVVLFCCLLAAAGTAEYYTVVPGDTLFFIAQRNGFPLTELLQANPQIDHPDLIYPGDTVYLPVLAVQSSEVADVLQRVNRLRQEAGLSALIWDAALARVAQLKAQDMAERQYFSHNSPTYGMPFGMMERFGLEFSAAGENLAFGQSTAAQVVEDWMLSPGHRANILSPSFTHMGIGMAQDADGTRFWAQMFTHPKA